MNRVRMLVHFGIKPYIVFDGDYLPSKSATEKDRATRRKESRKAGLELLRLGKTSQAHLELQKSIDVTPEMARQLIDELKKSNIDYVVAPYEADAQMVYLEKRGIIQAILSEDSDLLVFGAQCLLTKLDQYGDCIMINRADFTACREISLVGWSDAEFRTMSILSGCDYLASIDKMGLKTAYRLIRKHKTVERIIRSVQFDGKMKVPPGYLEAFNRAEATFLYQWVYCPEAKGLVNFSHPPEDVNLDDFPCIGKSVDSIIATGVAKGDLHPHTKEPIILNYATRSTPLASLRNSATFSTPDLKKHKSIESFFKPTRTPLAELDPNSFTPSPSQRQLLQRSPASWSAEPILRRPLTARDSPLAPSSAPQRVQRAVTEMRPPPIQTPKRQRLCSDGFYAVPSSTGHRLESGSSKFFASKASPSCEKKSDKGEFNLWSDDSVEEAMSQLPDDTGSQKTDRRSSRKLTVFTDERTDSGIGSAITAESPDSTAAEKLEEELSAPPEEPEETIFSSGLARNVDLLRRFKYSNGERAGHVSDIIEQQESELPRLEIKQMSAASTVPCSSPVTANEEATNEAVNKTEGFDDADWQEAESRPLNSLLSSGKTIPTNESVVRGSEDQIIPDSEGEEEEMTQHTGFSFDLAKFAFAG